MQESVIYRSIQEEAEARAEARQRREIAINLLQGGVNIELIASSTGLSIEEVQQLQQQLNNSAQS
jgi:predicted transposase YdaD